jgi:carnitine-CoA ligase
MPMALEKHCTLRELLERNARLTPELVVLRFDSGEQFTALELLQEVQLLAANLNRLGIEKGNMVLSWLPNCPLAVTLYLALNYLGAIYVPFNTAYRGKLLEHVIRISSASVMIADGRLIERLLDVDYSNLEMLIIDGNERLDDDALQQISADSLRQLSMGIEQAEGDGYDSKEIKPEATSTVIFTSGTTGPSKGVLCSYLHLYTSATEFKHVGPGDTNLVALPMFHVGGILGIWFALIHGGCAAYVDRFSTSKFWPTVKKLEITSVGLLGAMVQYLMSQAASPEDTNHPVTKAVIAPFGDDALAFGERFGIEVHTEFNMTELSVPLWGGPNPAARGTCGKPRQGVSLKLIDEHNKEVNIGETGELLVHVDKPYTISHGYLNDPEASKLAWRDGWFHTGDLFTRDEEDNYYFVDRAKDALRRRGENISSFEVEEELLSHPLIMAAAVVAAPGDGGEDEVMAILVTKNNVNIDLEELTHFLSKRLAHFMVPRYFRFVRDLPKTPTQKIEKHILRSEGITVDTLDREESGIMLKSDKLDKR